MTPNEIKEYLGTMVEIEKECYTHERLLQALKKRMAPLGHPKKIAEPTMKAAVKKFDTASDYGVISMLAGFIIITQVFLQILGSFKLLTGLNSILCLIGGIVTSAIPGTILGALIDNKKYKEELKRNQAEYEAAMGKYRQSVAADNKRVQKENRALAYLKTEYNAALKSYDALKDTRTELYNTNVLFEKYYYNFPAVSSLYEYFSAGRFTNLGDAYNQLELEVRLDRISLQLNVVISQLEKIKETQYVIYSAITESNEKLNSIIQSCSHIESGVQNMQLEGEELNSRIASLQVTSDLNLYVNAMNNLELKNISRWC